MRLKKIELKGVVKMDYSKDNEVQKWIESVKRRLKLYRAIEKMRARGWDIAISDRGIGGVRKGRR